MKTDYFRISKHCLIFILFFSSTILVKAQLTTNSNVTISELVNSITGDNISVSNITYSGASDARALFDGSNSNIGLSNGIILSTGYVSNASGPNDDPLNGSAYPNEILKSKDFERLGDNDLDIELGCNCCSNDAALLEFDIIPNISLLSMRYVFASEEYPYYVCSNFNDAFRIYVSGPKPGGGNYIKQNIAFIPGTTIPVAINSVNSGTPGWDPNCPCYWTSVNCTSLSYSQFFVNNGDGSTPRKDTTVQYNGFTMPLSAFLDVIPLKKYHFKIVIADITDGKYDSAILIEGKSLISGVKNECVTDNYINIFPNPTNGLINLSIKNKSAIKYECSIFNCASQLMFKKEFDINSANTEQKIDISSLPDGIYYLQLSDALDYKNSRKIVKIGK